MTQPSPPAPADGGLGGLISSTTGTAPASGSVPLNPDGTPNLGALSGGGPVTGQATIWNIPKEIQGTKIWYDIHDTAAANQTLTPAGPRYTPGTSAHSKGVYLTPSQIYANIAALSYNNPDQFLAIQKALADGNFGTVTPSGQFDAQTESALGTALTQWYKLSHGAGVAVDFNQYLTDSAARAVALGSGSGGSTKTAPIYRVTDPAAIRAAATSAFESATGKGPTKKQLDAFVTQYQSEQKNYESTAPGQTATQPTLTSDATAYAEQSDPQAYQQNQRQSYVSALVNMFAPSGSGRPNTTPVPNVTGG